MTKNSVKTRFAPSPTGFLHVGGLRTALFAYLFARGHDGKFLLRIEDTDRARLVEGATENIIESLKWVGIEFDEGPIYQSERLDVYRRYCEVLLKSGDAYYCNCTEERINQLKEQLQKRGEAFKYDRHCLNTPPEDVNGAAVRFKVADNQTVVFDDMILGKVEIKSDVLEDFVLLKKDAYPTYNFANVVDDHDMKISHVIRGPEFISSTPKHLLLYLALDFVPPVFAHVPTILGSDKSKLSKRHGAKNVLEYKDEGVLPEAIINFLGLLGWHPKDETEIFSLNELCEAFKLEDVQKSPAVFDMDKLYWFNAEYLKNSESAKLVQWARNIVNVDEADDQKLALILEQVRTRVKNYEDLTNQIEFFLRRPKPNTEEISKMDGSFAISVLDYAVEIVKNNSFDSFEDKMKKFAALNGASVGDVFMVVRIAVTGSRVSPPLLPSMEILGEEEVIARLGDLAKVIAK